jgi:cAMP phosphodiesterase
MLYIQGIEHDQHGRIVEKAPMMWIVDFGIGWVDASELETPEWDKWAEQIYRDGILIKVLLPNSTAVTALMDHPSPLWSIQGSMSRGVHL